jgi:hypothetical protein
MSDFLKVHQMECLLSYHDKSKKEIGFRCKGVDIVLLDCIGIYLSGIYLCNYINELDQIIVVKYCYKIHDVKSEIKDAFNQLRQNYKRELFHNLNNGFACEMPTLCIQLLNRVIQSNLSGYSFHYKYIEEYSMENITSKGKFAHIIDYLPIKGLAIYKFNFSHSKNRVCDLIPVEQLDYNFIDKYNNDIKKKLRKGIPLLYKTFHVLIIIESEPKIIVLDPIEIEYRIAIQTVYYNFITFLIKTKKIAVDKERCILLKIISDITGLDIIYVPIQNNEIQLPKNQELFYIEENQIAKGYIISHQGSNHDKYQKTIAHACYENILQFELRRQDYSYDEILDEGLNVLHQHIDELEKIFVF